jgi:CRISPR-associated protein Cas5d
MLSKSISIRVKGPFACFTQPVFHVERTSFPVVTPSAARGILEAILMKPIEKPDSRKRHNKVGFRWVIERIGVCRKVRFLSILRNEIQSPTGRGHLDGLASSEVGYDISKAEKDAGHRTQRHSLILRDVEYLLVARIEVPEFAGVNASSTLCKYFEMFCRRAKAGQCYYQPFFGCREFSVEVWEWIDQVPEKIPGAKEKEHFGRLFHDFDYAPIWKVWESEGVDVHSPCPSQEKWPEFGNPNAVHPTTFPGFDAVAAYGWIEVPHPPRVPTYERSHYIPA